MSSMVDWMQDGGPVMYLLLMLAMLAMLVVLVGAGLGLAKLRVPALLWLAVPLLLLCSGIGGTLQGLGMTAEAAAYASAEVKSTLAHAGYSVSQVTTIAGLLLACLALLGGAWAQALAAAVRPGEGAVLKPAAAAAAVVALVAGFGLAAWSLVGRYGAVSIGGSLVLASPALLLVGLRVGKGDDDRARLAEARLSVALCVLGAAAAAGLATYLDGARGIHMAGAHASAETRMTLIFSQVQVQQYALPAGGLAVIAATLAGALCVGALAREVASGRTLASVGAALVGLVLAGGLQLVTHSRAAALAPLWPETVLLGLRDAVTDLPAQVDLAGGDAWSDVGSFTHLLVEDGGSWHRRTADGREAVSLPLPASDAQRMIVALAASADASIQSITAQPWAEVPVTLHLITQGHMIPEAAGRLWLEPASLGSVAVTWGAPDAREAEAVVYLIEDQGGVRLEQAGARSVFTPTLAGAVTAARAREADSVAIVPGSSWSVQDIVSLALTLQDVPYSDEPAQLFLLTTYTAPAPEIERVPAPASFSERASAMGEGVPGEAQILGSLAPDQISAVVRRHMNQIRYCYQRELTKDPSLAGKVTVKFVVASDGSVSTADVQSSTLGNEAVERCLTGRFMRFQFPEPQGGGIVIVTYPFVFQGG